jgi:Ran GTPase-activating protein (RanGAP) involved in mRNA processing and transport
MIGRTKNHCLSLPPTLSLSLSYRALASNDTLTVLTLSQNPIGPRGAASLAKALAAGGGRALRRLDLDDCGITGEHAAAALGAALAANGGGGSQGYAGKGQLTSLNLSQNHLGSYGVGALVAGNGNDNGTPPSFPFNLAANRRLRTLRLDGVRAGVVGAEKFSRALAGNVALTAVSFASNGIRNLGAAAFAGALRANTTLRSLDLAFNDFDAASGGAALVAALSTEPGAGRDRLALNLHVDLKGNDGCETLIPPHLARSKLRMDFM